MGVSEEILFLVWSLRGNILFVDHNNGYKYARMFVAGLAELRVKLKGHNFCQALGSAIHIFFICLLL